MPIRGLMVDAETGSLDPRTGAVTSLAAVAFYVTDDGETREVMTGDFAALHLQVEPHEEAMLCAKSLKIQGETFLSLASRRGAVSETEAWAMFKDFFVAHSESEAPNDWHRHIWAWNASFDYAFLREMANRVPGTAGIFPYRCQWRCAQALYEVAVATDLLPDCGSTSLEKAAKSMNIEHTPHEALSDCLAAIEVLARTWKALRSPTA